MNILYNENKLINILMNLNEKELNIFLKHYINLSYNKI